MNSREKIIENLKKNKPGPVDLPQIRFAKKGSADLLSGFSTLVRSIGGSCQEVGGYEPVDLDLLQKKEEGLHCIVAVQESAHYNAEEFRNAGAAALNDVDVFMVKGKIAIAGNGAVWITEKEMINRLLPFLCRRLVIVIEEEAIVSTMHEAYERMAIDAEGYGVFIAGPSKTADIEQSLVIGAHGPLELQVFILKQN